MRISCTLQRAGAALALAAALAIATDALPWRAQAGAGPSEAHPILIGLSADQSAATRRAGESLRRGAMLAIKEINRNGGVLNRPFQLVLRDHRSTPARAVDNIEELAAINDLVAVIGGAHTPTATAELEPIHRHGIPYLVPWAAGTNVIENGRTPNFAFRVSASDRLVGPFLIRAAAGRGFKRPGLLLWNTAWGRSNDTAMTKAIEALGMDLAGVEWFNTSESAMSAQIDRLVDEGADVIMLVADPIDGAAAVRSMARQKPARRRPIISHWGITLGEFHNLTADILPDVDLSFLQTFSFLRPPRARPAERLYKAYCAEFEDCESPELVPTPGAVAHAYDLVRILALAIEHSGGTDRSKIRDALEHLKGYDGVMRRYDPPFTQARHEALGEQVFILCRFDPNGAILPLAPADG